MKRKHQWLISMTTDEFAKRIKKHGISNSSIVLGKYGWIEMRNYNSGLSNRTPNVTPRNSFFLRISPNHNGIKVSGVFGLPAPMLLAAVIALLGFLIFYITNVGFSLDTLIFIVVFFLPLCILLLLFKRAIEYGLRNRYEIDNQALIHLINSISIEGTRKEDE